MAKAVINLQKESGGITKISSADGTGVTELVVPESGELVNKEYADLKVALAQFTGSNQSLASSGYQKLPGGLIIQWGLATTVGGYRNFAFPVNFPTQCASVIANGANASFGNSPFVRIGNISTSTAEIYTSDVNGNGMNWSCYYVAIGY